MDPDPAVRMHHLLYARHSARAPFDPAWHVTPHELEHLVEAARWAPTPHDMQNFELVVVEDPTVLAKLGAIRAPVSPLFIAESYHQLASDPEELAELIAGAPMVIVVIFDPTTHAPASEHDGLGMIGLGCILENMWLIAQTLRLDLQVVSSFSAPEVESQVEAVLAIPPPWRIAYALRIGHAIARPTAPHIRRDVPRFVHRDHFAK